MVSAAAYGIIEGVDTGEDSRRRGPYAAGGDGRGRRRRHPVLAAVAALVLLGLTAVLVARGIDRDGPTPLPQLLAFLPWLLAPGWLALLAAVLARRALLVVWALGVLAATGWYVQPYGPAAPDGAEERPAKARFRVLTANLQRGGATDALVELALRERPQVLAVQECDHRCVRALQAPRLREAYPHRVVAGVDGGARGSALLSRYPLRRTAGVPGELAMPGAVARIGGERVRIQVAHPMPPTPGDLDTWRRELDRLRRLAADRDGLPTLIAGDFNSSQDHAAFRAVLATGMHDAARLVGMSRTPTWPSRTAPPLGAQIDHVLLSKELVPLDGSFHDLPGSDHRAFLADVKLFPR